VVCINCNVIHRSPTVAQAGCYTYIRRTSVREIFLDNVLATTIFWLTRIFQMRHGNRAILEIFHSPWQDLMTTLLPKWHERYPHSKNHRSVAGPTLEAAAVSAPAASDGPTTGMADVPAPARIRPPGAGNPASGKHPVLGTEPAFLRGGAFYSTIQYWDHYYCRPGTVYSGVTTSSLLLLTGFQLK